MKGFSLFKRKPWIETLKVEELEKEKIRIENHIALISKEIERLERQKKELFRKGIGKSDIEKLLLAEKIKDIDAEIRMKLKECNRLIKQRRALSNLIRLKTWESRLREKGIWEKIKSVEPETLVRILSEIEFEEAQFDRNIDKINEILGAKYEAVEMDEATQELMKLWERVEKAELTPEAVEEHLAVKVTEEEKEKEKEKEKELL